MRPMPLFYVVCEDDKVRHDAPFTDYAEAVTFAENGHACTAATSHRVARITLDGRAIRRIGSAFWGPLGVASADTITRGRSS